MPILGFPADARLIDLDQSHQQAVLPYGERRTNAVTQMPCGFLRDAKITRHFRANDPFQAAEHQIHGGRLDPTTEWRGMHDRVGFHRKVTTTVTTPVGQG